MKYELEPNIKKQLQELKEAITEIEKIEYDCYIEKLKNAIKEINLKEEKLNKLIEERNNLQEYKNKLRHIEKKSKAYNIEEYKSLLKTKYKNMSSLKIRKKINYLAKVLVDMDKKESNTLWNFIISILVLRKKPEFLKQNGILMHLMMEEYYIKSLIEESEKSLENFDDLYKQIPTYIPTIKGIDNPYEEKAYNLIKQYIEKSKNKYKFTYKLPLAEFVTDKKYLQENPELRKFILRNSHLDFAIYTTNINKPVLAIEVDGEKHNEEKQKKRDIKKEEILNYMEIPLLRIPSKNTWSIEDFEKKVEEHLLKLK